MTARAMSKLCVDFELGATFDSAAENASLLLPRASNDLMMLLQAAKGYSVIGNEKP